METKYTLECYQDGYWVVAVTVSEYSDAVSWYRYRFNRQAEYRIQKHVTYTTLVTDFKEEK